MVAPTVPTNPTIGRFARQRIRTAELAAWLPRVIGKPVHPAVAYWAAMPVAMGRIPEAELVAIAAEVGRRVHAARIRRPDGYLVEFCERAARRLGIQLPTLMVASIEVSIIELEHKGKPSEHG